VFAGPFLGTYAAAMVPTPDGTGVVVFGGFNSIKNMYELKCSSNDCNWSPLETKLRVDRTYSVVMYVPDSFAYCP
jgi:hypothetical protein